MVSTSESYTFPTPKISKKPSLFISATSRPKVGENCASDGNSSMTNCPFPLFFKRIDAKECATTWDAFSSHSDP
jgi:hypothetical protein|tara:strand:+ start:245 stop:466 length:222 start_codon:yes stop_codon:yes gene_type:complete